MNRLQEFCPRGSLQSPRPVPDLQAAIADGTSLKPVLGIIAAAQPKDWTALCGEVDLSFHWEFFSALDSIPWDSETWSSAKRRVESKVSDLCHVAHTVNERLEALVTTEAQAWLLYTQGASSLWAESVEYAGRCVGRPDDIVPGQRLRPVRAFVGRRWHRGPRLRKCTGASPCLAGCSASSPCQGLCAPGICGGHRQVVLVFVARRHRRTTVTAIERRQPLLPHGEARRTGLCLAISAVLRPGHAVLPYGSSGAQPSQSSRAGNPYCRSSYAAIQNTAG